MNNRFKAQLKAYIFTGIASVSDDLGYLFDAKKLVGTGNPFATKALAEAHIRGKFQIIFLEKIDDWTNGLSPDELSDFLLKFNVDVADFDDNINLAKAALMQKINTLDSDVFSFIKVK